METVIQFIIWTVFGIPLAILRGLVIVQLWLWFAVAQFGVAELSIPMAIGLSYIVGLATHQYVPDSSSDETATLNERMAKRRSFNLIYSLMAWGCGYVVSLFL